MSRSPRVGVVVTHVCICRTLFECLAAVVKAANYCSFVQPRHWVFVPCNLGRTTSTNVVSPRMVQKANELRPLDDRPLTEIGRRGLHKIEELCTT